MDFWSCLIFCLELIVGFRALENRRIGFASETTGVIRDVHDMTLRPGSSVSSGSFRSGLFTKGAY